MKPPVDTNVEPLADENVGFFVEYLMDPPPTNQSMEHPFEQHFESHWDGSLELLADGNVENAANEPNENVHDAPFVDGEYDFEGLLEEFSDLEIEQEEDAAVGDNDEDVFFKFTNHLILLVMKI